MDRYNRYNRNVAMYGDRDFEGSSGFRDPDAGGSNYAPARVSNPPPVVHDNVPDVPSATVQDWANVLGDVSHIGSYLEEQKSISESVINKVPWEVLLGTLLATNVMRELTNSTLSKILFGTSLGLSGYKLYTYSTLGIQPEVDKEGRFSTSSRVLNFVDKVGKNTNGLIMAASLGASILSLMLIGDSTSHLAFTISAIPSGIVMYKRVTDSIAIVESGLGSVKDFFKEIGQDIEEIPNDIKEKIENIF